MTDIDALIARLRDKDKRGWDDHDNAAAALKQQQDEIVRLKGWHLAALRTQLPHALTDVSTPDRWEREQAAAICNILNRAEKAEAEVARLKLKLSLTRTKSDMQAGLLVSAEAERDAAMKLLTNAAQHAEFRDKIIHFGNGDRCQTWELTVFLSVPPNSGVSARAALDSAIDAARGKANNDE
jgi:hypothetical protein